MNPPDDNLAAALATASNRTAAAAGVRCWPAIAELLWDWNAKINLTRHTDYEKFVARDLIDSLAFAQFLEPKEKVLDVGTGGGVPGVVLAIVRADLQCRFRESVGKKARAVADIVERLGLPMPVLHARAEEILAQRAVRHAGGSGGGPAEEAAGMVPAGLGAVSTGCWCSRARLGRRTGRGPALWTAPRSGVAEADVVSAAGHRVGERVAANSPQDMTLHPPAPLALIPCVPPRGPFSCWPTN